MPREAVIVGGTTWTCGLTVTVGCAPSRMRVDPCHWVLEVATTAQSVMPGAEEDIAAKVNMRLSPGCINAAVSMPVKSMAPLDRV